MPGIDEDILRELMHRCTEDLHAPSAVSDGIVIRHPKYPDQIHMTLSTHNYIRFLRRMAKYYDQVRIKHRDEDVIYHLEVSHERP